MADDEVIGCRRWWEGQRGSRRDFGGAGRGSSKHSTPKTISQLGLRNSDRELLLSLKPRPFFVNTYEVTWKDAQWQLFAS